jgi:peroxiredoxin
VTLHEGSAAPDFSLRDQHGSTVSLSRCLTRGAVAVVFYPFAFSGVCTEELRSLRDAAPQLAGEGLQVLAVSCDPVFSLRVLADRDGLGFPLLSDFWPHGEVSAAYGAFDERRGCPTRSTFVVDTAGLVRWSVHNPSGQARDMRAPGRVLAGLR